jgi:hypothetical protein
MRIFAVISGEYGARHVRNLEQFGPSSWQIKSWQAPAAFPLMVDYPEDFLPASLPATDLVCAFAEHKGVIELLPDIVRMTGGSAVLAPVDSEAWLPRGLARQLKEWLDRMGVACATPKPLCSLTEYDYGVTRRQRQNYDNPLIAEFARYFGQPSFDVTVDPDTSQISAAQVKRDAVCGCARYVAEHLIGVSADEAVEKSGLLHHHFPCLASMGVDSDFGDTLMHISGNVFRDDIAAQVKPYTHPPVITPGKRSE